MKRTKKGFTLTELLVTIAILAVIATVSIVGYTSFINRANDSNAATELEQIQAYIEADLMVDNKWEFQDKDGNRYLVTRNNKKLTAFNVVGDEYQPAKLGDVISKCPDFKDLGTITVDNAGVITYTRANGKGTATWEGMTAQPDSEIGGNTNPDEPVCAHEGGEATCVAQAICTLCGMPYGDLAANNHNIVTDAAVEATCTTTGLTEGSHCTRCNNATVAQEVVPVNDNHSLTDVAEVPATCTTPGTAAGQRCTREGCTYTTGMGVLPVTGHSFGDDGECIGCDENNRAVWELVTDASQLADGKYIVIVASGDHNVALGGQKTNNRAAIDITKSGNTIEINDSVQIITLESVQGGYALKVDGGYLMANGGAGDNAKNYLHTRDTIAGNSTWEIVINSDSTANITAQGDAAKNKLKYNAAENTGNLFSCYSTAQTPISIYVNTNDNYSYTAGDNIIEGGDTDEEPETPDDGSDDTVSYQKTTSIAVGDKVIFVCESKKYELTSINSGNYGNGVAYTSAPQGTMVFEVVEGSTAGTFAFKNGDKYLSWSSGNSLTTSTTLNDNSSWSVTFDDDGNAIILNGKDNARKLQWNASSPRFACYTSSQTAICIYKLEGGTSGGNDGEQGGTQEPVTPVVSTLATFELGANGSASHSDGSSKTEYTETVDGYTLNIINGTNMYTGARDAKGNSCLKLGTSSKAGSFSFTVPENVTEVVIYVAKYKANAATVKINGTATALTEESNDGQYDVISIDTTTTKTISFTVSSGYRCMVNTIVFNGTAN